MGGGGGGARGQDRGVVIEGVMQFNDDSFKFKINLK